MHKYYNIYKNNKIFIKLLSRSPILKLARDYARATLDIDIFIYKTYGSNTERTWHALKEFGYDVTDVEIEDLLEKKLLIRQYTVETDIHPFVNGVSFDQIWENKVRGKFSNTFIYFASLDDLIKMKQTAGRTKDIGGP